MFRRPRSAVAFGLALLIFGQVLPAWADDPALTPDEERQILEAVEELKAAREEIARLRAVLTKDQETIGALQVQVRALETLVGAQDKMLTGLMKISDAQGRLIGEYRQFAALAQDRADRAEAKAERLEKWALYGTVGGLVIGLIGGALAVMW